MMKNFSPLRIILCGKFGKFALAKNIHLFLFVLGGIYTIGEYECGGKFTFFILQPQCASSQIHITHTFKVYVKFKHYRKVYDKFTHLTQKGLICMIE